MGIAFAFVLSIAFGAGDEYLTVKPIHFADVKIAEAAVGLAFAATVVTRRHRGRSLG